MISLELLENIVQYRKQPQFPPKIRFLLSLLITPKQSLLIFNLLLSQPPYLQIFVRTLESKAVELFSRISRHS